MSILIKGMEMPKSCNECILEIEEACGLKAEPIPDYWSRLDRPSWCPLKPLPEKKHGRLIDADVYLKKVCTYKETGCGSCRFQTVCPADEPTINDSLDEIGGEIDESNISS